jgi:hypothetical protein
MLKSNGFQALIIFLFRRKGSQSVSQSVRQAGRQAGSRQAGSQAGYSESDAGRQSESQEQILVIL